MSDDTEREDGLLAWLEAKCEEVDSLKAELAKRSKRGGKREGSGRPCKGSSPRSTVGVRMSPETREMVRRLADRMRCSQSDAIELAVKSFAWEHL